MVVLVVVPAFLVLARLRSAGVPLLRLILLVRLHGRCSLWMEMKRPLSRKVRACMAGMPWGDSLPWNRASRALVPLDE